MTPHASNCCKQDMVLKRGGKVCHCVYPIKLDILLLNVSQSPDWDKFLEELATQLGLQNNTQIDRINFYVINFSTLNISMDITPHKGISFSANEASKINSSLSMHKVRLDPGLVGGYKLLNIIWFEPPPPTQAPTLTASPEKAPLYHSPTATSLSSSNKGGHSNLFLVLGIAIGMLFHCSCIYINILLVHADVKEKKTPPIETEKPRIENAVSAGSSIPCTTGTRPYTKLNLQNCFPT